jgi:hypothetical protein
LFTVVKRLGWKIFAIYAKLALDKPDGLAYSGIKASQTAWLKGK